jgi:SpoVK/Ycf46/Vps4 family AAA+-type ATPase
MTTDTKTRSQKVASDVQALLRARTPLLWIVTNEEARVERHLIEAAAAASYVPRTWDVAQGVVDLAGKRTQIGSPDLAETLTAIGARAASTASSPERGVWILRDAPAWLEGLAGAQPNRALRNLARSLPASPRDRAQAIIVLTPSAKVPQELAGHATVIEWPLPDRAEIAAILDATISALPADIRDTAAPNGARDSAIDAAVGLSGDEAQSCYAKSLVQLRRIDPAAVANEKKRVIAKERVLEWYDPIEGGIAAVGGLEPLKAWLGQRKLAYSPAAKAYGLPSPKGVMFVGPPGTGKSLTAKAIATAWQIPLLKVDLGALKSKFVGESESNLRKAFSVIESVGRCIVWFDEVEKSLAGATQGAADGGVSSDALGAILTWMQEKRGEAFVVATANDAASLPPELLRKGRFDELFFLDLPSQTERAQILQTALVANGRGAVVIDHAKIAKATDGWTGSEIAAIVPDALFGAFADGEREITTDDLVEAAKSVVPLSKTAAEKIARLREWAAGRARPANTPYVADAAKETVELDI